VTAEAVQAVAEAHVRPEAAAIVLVGDADAFVPALEAADLGPVTVERDTGPQDKGRDSDVEEAVLPVDEGSTGPGEGAEEPVPGGDAEADPA